MSQICESCGSPDATLYAFYPAVLCRECVAIRVAERKAAEAYREAAQKRKALESAPDPRMMFSDPDAGAEAMDTEGPEGSDQDDGDGLTASQRRRRRKVNRDKNARRKQRKEEAKVSFAVIQSTLPAQAALIRVNIHAGNDDAALLMAKATLEAFVRTGFASLTGVMNFAWPADRMASRLRTGELINSAGLAAIIKAIASDPEFPATAGLYLHALEVLAFGPESESEKSRRSRRKRILREGERIARSFDADPFPEVTREDAAAMAVELLPGFSHRVCIERADDAAVHYGVGKLFEDTPDDLRSLANLAIGLQKGLPGSYRLTCENVDPVTLQTLTR